MKKKNIIIIGVIVLLAIAVLAIGGLTNNDSEEIKKLLNEKYGEDFVIIHDNGNEYSGGLLPTFNKTGYKNVIASPVKNDEIKFNVRLKIKPLEIYTDDYLAANIANNTSKLIEKNYKIGNKMYVYTSATEYTCEGEKTESFFDDVDGRGTVSISIYVEGLDKTFNGKDYLDKLANDLKAENNTTGKLRIYSVKTNGIEEIKKYYKNSKDLVSVESGDNNIKAKYLEALNKDNVVNF